MQSPSVAPQGTEKEATAAGCAQQACPPSPSFQHPGPRFAITQPLTAEATTTATRSTPSPCPHFPGLSSCWPLGSYSSVRGIPCVSGPLSPSPGQGRLRASPVRGPPEPVLRCGNLRNSRTGGMCIAAVTLRHSEGDKHATVTV